MAAMLTEARSVAATAQGIGAALTSNLAFFFLARTQ